MTLAATSPVERGNVDKLRSRTRAEPGPLGGAVQIAKTGTLRAKPEARSWRRSELLKRYQLPLALIAIAMLAYILIAWEWL